MRILAVGDVIGKSGIDCLKEKLSKITQENNIDFVIVNAENTGDGMGITAGSYKELSNLGINVMTLGNHTWSKKDVFSLLDNENLIRPANFYKDLKGKRI